MATLSTLKRFARLCGWVALSGGAMVAAACGSMLSAACSSSAFTVGNSHSDARTTTDAGAAQMLTLPEASAPDTAKGEANPVDADESDLWNVICE